MVTAFDSCSDYTDSNDGNYIPGEESDYSSDDYLPLSTFCVSKKQAQNKKTNNSKPGSPLADLKNHRVVNDNCQADKGETADTVNQYVCSSSNATQLTAKTPSKAAVCSVPNFASRKRSRKAKPETWQRNVRKHRFNSGKSSMGKDNKLGSPKKMKISCGSKCRYQCKQQFSEMERENIFHMFWRLSSIDKQR